MSRTETEHITYGSTRIDYRIRRSGSRLSIAITVDPDTSVTVSVPKGVRRKRVAVEVRRKASWVIKQQDWFRRHYRRHPRRFVSGETFLYLGRQYQLRVARDSAVTRASVVLARGTLRVTVPGESPVTAQARRVRALLLGWYRRHALKYVSRVCEVSAKRLGVRYQSLRILEMKIRWGSSGGDGKLRFNWRIAMAPRSLVEYVVAHELCHIRHGQHSPAFWRLLASVMPDYEERRQRLTALGPTLDF